MSVVLFICKRLCPVSSWIQNRYSLAQTSIKQIHISYFKYYIIAQLPVTAECAVEGLFLFSLHSVSRLSLMVPQYGNSNSY